MASIIGVLMLTINSDGVRSLAGRCSCQFCWACRPCRDRLSIVHDAIVGEDVSRHVGAHTHIPAFHFLRAQGMAEPLCCVISCIKRQYGSAGEL